MILSIIFSYIENGTYIFREFVIGALNKRPREHGDL